MEMEELVSEFSVLVASGKLSGWFGNPAGGPWVQKFEKSFADYNGARYAVAVSSGTAALHCALLASGVSKGDRVVTTAYTHIGGVSPILMCGAIPVFVDSEFDSFNIDFAPVGPILTGRTTAIIASHQLGYPCDMASIDEYSGKVAIIEDASQSLGAKYGKRRVGTIGDVGIFSVGGDMTKSITTGEGGVIITNNEEIAERCRALRNHGDRYGSKQFLCYDYRMSDLQALVGYFHLRSIDQEIAWQIERGKYIIEQAPPYLISRQQMNPEIEPAFYILGFEANDLDPKKVVTSFESAGISKNVPRLNINRGYRELVFDLPYYREFKRSCPNSEEKVRKAIWIDYHRRPRTYSEINKMLDVARRIQ